MLGWKRRTVANTLAYCNMAEFTAAKGFIVQVDDIYRCLYKEGSLHWLLQTLQSKVSLSVHCMLSLVAAYSAMAVSYASKMFISLAPERVSTRVGSSLAHKY